MAALFDHAPAVSHAPFDADSVPPAGNAKRRLCAAFARESVERPARFGYDRDRAFGSDQHRPIRGGFAHLRSGFSAFE